MMWQYLENNKMTYTVKVNVYNSWFIRCSTNDLKLAIQQADKMRKQGFKVKFIREQD
jgi:hypothetical protein